MYLEEKDGIKFYSLNKLEKEGFDVHSLPYSLRILAENILRHLNNGVVSYEHIENIFERKGDIPFYPARIIMQDYTGVPAIVDLAAMRDYIKEKGKDPSRVNPKIPVELVVDHSLIVLYHGTKYSLYENMKEELKANRERYSLLKWASKAFENLKIIPPGKGIIHQINVEHLARIVFLEEGIAYPDTVLGTDSHTPMVNGIGVLGWGVGGIEAEAALLGLPYFMKVPEVVGVVLEGEPSPEITPTDIVLTITEKLRKVGVVGKFLEYTGNVEALSAFDRTVIANMTPENGATVGYFPIDEETIKFIRLTRGESKAKLVEKYAKLNMLYREETPEFDKTVKIDLSKVEPSVAGPFHPEDRIRLKDLKNSFKVEKKTKIRINGGEVEIEDGIIGLAAIASCTNTSNPYNILAAALVAKKAVELGLRTKPWVKTTFTPGSRVVVKYLEKLGLLSYLEALGFHVNGYACASCIGNSGPLKREVEEVIDKGIKVAAVISGNRNFRRRVNSKIDYTYLASPPLVVVFAIAGKITIDPSEPLAYDPNGKPVYLTDILPTKEEVKKLEEVIGEELYKEAYSSLFEDSIWKDIETEESPLFKWDEKSTYVRKPPFFDLTPITDDIKGARALIVLGDRISTDDISPAGKIDPESPAGRYLLSLGVKPEELHTYGARRGNHEVMMRGTFARFKMIYWPTGEEMSVYEAAMRYKERGIPLIIIAGKQYGVGSSRDWAAKGPALLGVKAVIAESFERIHRSNLVGMGIVPLQFKDPEVRKRLTGEEVYDIIGLKDLYPGKTIKVIARKPNGEVIEFETIARVETPIEVEYIRHGGILKYALELLG
ncbi:aconitate hydratase AcnA [Pyrococcus furiosus DSM 3638]|uniref:Aconitate hydratase AcnA n=3 Tax=Pyrococcus furiosus TaxID=2261 RepID=A0A5C0XM98_PYRFU|nr:MULTISPECIES: aconitate hydratase AcnA [Pyrococcus]AAL80325.1 aconitate hydratase (aconitase) [Pyrococcus furiosus DSM 3638]AFN02989.1 aconitate hydratase [Pyrococcus furiosus COM1]MDK2869209.1 aconitate hydratase [Pyrococcus sp.]QEK77927.1 aconitate hydratase AcnA [Pyrococcus furiosus DSM 3638]